MSVWRCIVEVLRTFLLLRHRAFRAGDIEMRFDETERAILDLLSGEGLVDLSNDGFRLTETGGAYAVR